MDRDSSHWKMLPSNSSHLTLNATRDGAFINSLGSLGSLTIFWVKNFLLTLNLNLHSFNLKLLPLVPSLSDCVKRLFSILLMFSWSTGKPQWGLHEGFSSSGWITAAPSTILCKRDVPLLWSSLWLSAEPTPITPCLLFAGLLTPEYSILDETSWWQSRVCKHVPRPPGHPSLDTAQDTGGLLGYKCTLLAHVQLFTHHNPQVLLWRAVLKEFFS